MNREYEIKDILVSVIIPTHRRPEMLRRAISSVINQSYKNIELIIIDDGSNDSTQIIVNELIKKYVNYRIYYYAFRIPRGACVARNKGIQIAKGEFITGLDDDDEFLPTRVEQLLSEYDDRYAFLCSDIIIHKRERQSIIKSKKNISFNDLLWANIVGPQIFVKRSRLLELNGFDESLSSAQDYDLWLRLSQKYGDAKRIHIPLYIVHTEHNLPRITTSSKKNNGYFTVFLRYKKYMTKRQRIYNLLKFKILSNRKVPRTWIFALFPSYYFFNFIYLELISIFPEVEILKRIFR